MHDAARFHGTIIPYSRSNQIVERVNFPTHLAESIYRFARCFYGNPRPFRLRGYKLDGPGEYGRVGHFVLYTDISMSAYKTYITGKSKPKLPVLTRFAFAAFCTYLPTYEGYFLEYVRAELKPGDRPRQRLISQMLSNVQKPELAIAITEYVYTIKAEGEK